MGALPPRNEVPNVIVPKPKGRVTMMEATRLAKMAFHEAWGVTPTIDSVVLNDNVWEVIAKGYMKIQDGYHYWVEHTRVGILRIDLAGEVLELSNREAEAYSRSIEQASAMMARRIAERGLGRLEP